MAHTTEEVTTFEQQRLGAMLSKNIPMLASLLDQMLIYVHSTGQCMTKDEYLSHVLEPGFDYLAIKATPIAETIGLNGTAVLVQSVTASIRKPQMSAPIALEMTVLTVWLKSPAGWQLLSSISTPLPERRK